MEQRVRRPFQLIFRENDGLEEAVKGGGRKCGVGRDRTSSADEKKRVDRLVKVHLGFTNALILS